MYYEKLPKKVFSLFYPHLPLFGALLVLQSIQLVLSYLFIDKVGIGLWFGTIAWAYILTLPLNFIRYSILRGIYVGVVFTISLFMGIIELFCGLVLEEWGCSTHILLISYTNFNESTEFLSTYVDYKLILIILFIIVLSISTYLLSVNIKSQIVKVSITIVCLLSAIFSSYFGIWYDCGIGRVVNSIFSLKKIESYNFEETQPLFNVCELDSFHPNIILIIGESFDKKHSSLYGYGKETNPLLKTKQMDSTLIVFLSVQASGSN